MKTKKEKAKKPEPSAASMNSGEEGTLTYTRQNGFGVEWRTTGSGILHGVFFEIGRRRTQRFTTTYSIELSEIHHAKEEKLPGNNFNNPVIYGKINNFYQVKLGYGQQYIFGQKGNKNGVAIIGLAQGGLSMGLLKPYYVNALVSGVMKEVKWSIQDSAYFLNPESAVGFTKGWGELQLKPGIFLKAAIRFDFGRFNESVSAIEIGASVEAYADRIEIMAPVTDDIQAVGPQRFFFSGHIAYVFGRRK